MKNTWKEKSEKEKSLISKNASVKNSLSCTINGIFMKIENGCKKFEYNSWSFTREIELF